MKPLLVLGISLSVFLLPSQPSLAQTPSVPQPSTEPLQLTLLRPGGASNDSVITAFTIRQQELTIPSLWWVKEQFGDKLLDNWLAYPANGNTAARVDLVVNQQLWSLLDYLQRYEFVNHFGTTARDYGYNVRVFNYQKELLATYTCNFSTTPGQCNVQIDASGTSSLRRQLN